MKNALMKLLLLPLYCLMVVCFTIPAAAQKWPAE